MIKGHDSLWATGWSAISGSLLVLAQRVPDWRERWALFVGALGGLVMAGVHVSKELREWLDRRERRRGDGTKRILLPRDQTDLPR